LAVAQPPPTGSNSPRLTLQQSAVMQLLAQGRSIKDIARTLDLGVGTVKTHLSHAYASLGAHNKVQAIARSGILKDASQ
jgi:DNA-binding NarL/FixJ family response regulator